MCIIKLSCRKWFLKADSVVSDRVIVVDYLN